MQANPDHSQSLNLCRGLPDSKSNLIRFIQEVHGHYLHQRPLHTPIVVHCRYCEQARPQVHHFLSLRLLVIMASMLWQMF